MVEAGSKASSLTPKSTIFTYYRKGDINKQGIQRASGMLCSPLLSEEKDTLSA